jgi:hypothetical protein
MLIMDILHSFMLGTLKTGETLIAMHIIFKLLEPGCLKIIFRDGSIHTAWLNRSEPHDPATTSK